MPEPVDDFERALDAAESVTEGDEIQCGRLGTADGKRCREPSNLGKGRKFELRFHIELEADLPYYYRPPRPADKHLSDLHSLAGGTVKSRSREEANVVVAALHSEVIIEPSRGGWRPAHSMLGRYDQEDGRTTGKPSRAWGKPLELTLCGDPAHSALLGGLLNRHNEISARLQIIK